MLTISIVSHNQLPIMYDLITELLKNINYKIIITINIEEDETLLNNLPTENLKIIKNKKPVGFPENHNNAFRYCSTDYFLILNPDVLLNNDLVDNTLNLMIEKEISILSPLAVSHEGTVLDNSRRFPKIYTPFLRLFSSKYKSDYQFSNDSIHEVDWISGMFIMIESSLYRDLDGFDERFFLYYDDVDLCKRVHQHGSSVYLTSKYTVIHEGNRLSKKSLKYFLIHIVSLLKYHLKHGL